MNDIIAARHICLPYFANNMAQATTIVVVNREDEPFDYVSEAARWFYRTLKGILVPQKKTLDCSNFEYWFRIGAREFSDKPQYADYCWSTARSNDAEFRKKDKYLHNATLWYSYLREEVALGTSYLESKRMSLEHYMDMDEEHAIAWANSTCPKIVGNLYSDIPEYLQERIL